MQGAQIHYTVTNNGDILVQLETLTEKITLISAIVVKNPNDFTLEILTEHLNTGGPDKLNIPPELAESSAPGSMLMIIDWSSRLGSNGAVKPVKRRKTSTLVEELGTYQ